MSNSNARLIDVPYSPLIHIICDGEQKAFLRKLIMSIGIDESRISILCDSDLVDSIFCVNRPLSEAVLISASLTWSGRDLQEFYGFDIGSRLRREHSLRNAIVFFTPLSKSCFESLRSSDDRYALLDARGTGFISFPSPTETIRKAVMETEPLSTEELPRVVIECCGIRQQWREVAHQLGSLFANPKNEQSEIRRLVDEWAKTVNRFAPQQRDKLENLRKLLQLPPDSIEPADLKQALEEMDRGLQNPTLIGGVGALRTDNHRLPRFPPKGFSRVLIADDEPQEFLINSLCNQFGYDVIKEQAFKLSQAKELLDREKPDVVLSDYYFKESSRSTEIPDKAVGDRFIRYALNHRRYATTDLKKPIVLVTSKATLRTETDIRAGAINCSGASRATDPLFIHGMIWAEARKRGVVEVEELSGQKWTLEHACRQRIEQYQEQLPKLIGQWNEFRKMICDTLRLCRLLYESPLNDDPEIVQQVIRTLEAYETEDSFSLELVGVVFAETEKAHKSARTQPDSQAKESIRNILHGKIEQFSSVTNAVKFLINILPELAEDLVSLPRHQRIGQQLYETLQGYSDSEPLLPFLTNLNGTLAQLLLELPELPFSSRSARHQSVVVDSNNVHIVVVEDNEYWKDYVISAIKKAESILGAKFSISYQHFDNTAEALASMRSTSKSFAIDGSDQNETKTIAIVDICLPENKEHVGRIQAALDGRSKQLAAPSKTHGLNLIRTLCSYNYNLPLIVYSTIDSIGDRKAIGAWGVPDEDFLAKGIDDDNAIVRALVRKIEKKTKYVIKSFEGAFGDSRFSINGVGIPFPKELGRTFSAVYTLRQTTGRKEFSVSEIASVRGDSASEDSKNVIQDQMYRIRSLILETLQSNRIYVNIRELIRTRKSTSDEYTYELNGEVMPPGEEEDYETDLQQYTNDVCRVLVIENDTQTLGEIIEPLESLGYKVQYATNVEDAVRVAIDFLPHVISLDLQIPRNRAEAESPEAFREESAGLDAWKQIRTTLSSNTIGIVVPTVNADKNHFVAKAAQMEIPIRNFISKFAPNWHNLLLKKVDDEKRRVFLGEVTDARRDINEPIVEILDDSQLSEGVLYLMVNNEPFTMNKSPVAKIVGLLLSGPKTLFSFETIKAVLGSGEPVTKDDSKNWTKRIRAIIKNKWLKSSQDDSNDLSKKILESSAQGLRLNVHVIDSREK